MEAPRAPRAGQLVRLRRHDRHGRAGAGAAGETAGRAAADRHAIFTLSAKNQASLTLQLERYRRFLDDHPDVAARRPLLHDQYRPHALRTAARRRRSRLATGARAAARRGLAHADAERAAAGNSAAATWPSCSPVRDRSTPAWARALRAVPGVPRSSTPAIGFRAASRPLDPRADVRRRRKAPTRAAADAVYAAGALRLRVRAGRSSGCRGA